MTRLVLATALLVLVAAAPAAARPPGGDWTLVRKDSYVHYACKRDRGDDFVVKTAAWFNGKGQMIKEYPAWANLASGPRSRIRSKFTRSWVEGFAVPEVQGRQRERPAVAAGRAPASAPSSRGAGSRASRC